MAEGDDDLDLKPAGAGVLFRAEMFTTNVLLGYWKHLVALLVVVLLGFLFYGQYQNWVERTQREATARIAAVEAGLPAGLPDLPRLIATDDPAVDPQELTAAAEQLEAIAEEVNGPAQVEALLKAAELHRLTGATDAQRAALERASAEADGVLRYAAEGALANLELEQGEGEQAVARLRKLTEEYDGFLAQQATLDLALALEHLERGDEAAQVYADFLQKWPDARQADQVRQRQARLGGAG